MSYIVSIYALNVNFMMHYSFKGQARMPLQDIAGRLSEQRNSNSGVKSVGNSLNP